MIVIKKEEEAIEIILEQKPLLLFQAKGELGPRALGNRSILFDPRNKDVQKIINTIKKREWWRPVAGTVHVDGTCRIQTLKEEDNSKYYSLINAFYKKTGVPILCNTSLNLAGYPIIENLKQLKEITKTTEFKNVYLP